MCTSNASLPNHWENLPDDWSEYEGFIYRITNTITNQMYIGRKYFYTKKKTKIVGVSDWPFYCSSSKKVKAAIAEYGKDAFKFEIVSVHRNRQTTNYAEVELQIKEDVLTTKLPNGLEAYYNDNILSKYFKPKDFGSPEYDQKCKNISVAIQKLFKEGRVHPLKGKPHPNRGRKLPQCGHSKGKGKRWYHKGEHRIQIAVGESPPKGYTLGLGKQTKPRETKVHTKVCAFCASDFTVTYRTKNQKYCSQQCKNNAHSERMKAKKRNS